MTTYALSVSGSTLTITPSDGSPPRTITGCPIAVNYTDTNISLSTNVLFFSVAWEQYSISGSTQAAKVLAIEALVSTIDCGSGGGGGSAWDLAGNNLAGGEVFGSTNNVDVPLNRNGVQVGKLIAGGIRIGNDTNYTDITIDGQGKVIFNLFGNLASDSFTQKFAGITAGEVRFVGVGVYANMMQGTSQSYYLTQGNTTRGSFGTASGIGSWFGSETANKTLVLCGNQYVANWINGTGNFQTFSGFGSSGYQTEDITGAGTIVMDLATSELDLTGTDTAATVQLPTIPTREDGHMVIISSDTVIPTLNLITESGTVPIIIDGVSGLTKTLTNFTCIVLKWWGTKWKLVGNRFS